MLRQLASESEQRSHLALSDPDPDRAQGDKGQAAARELDWRAEFRWVFTGSGVEDPAAAAATLVTVDERSSDWTTRTVGKARAWLQMREAAGDLISAAEVGDFIGFQRTHAEQLEHARLCRNVGVLFRDKLRQHADALELQREGLAVDAACYGEMHPVVGQVSRLASILRFGQPASVVSVAFRSRHCSCQCCCCCLLHKTAHLARNRTRTQDYEEMALVYLALEDYTRALECYDKSHAIFLRAYGAGSIELAGLLCRIAECYRQQRDLTRSLALCVSFSSAQPSFVIIFTFFSVHLAQPIG